MNVQGQYGWIIYYKSFCTSRHPGIQVLYSIKQVCKDLKLLEALTKIMGKTQNRVTTGSNRFTSSAIQNMFKTRQHNFQLQFLNSRTIGPTRDSQCMAEIHQGLLLNFAIVQ